MAVPKLKKIAINMGVGWGFSRQRKNRWGS
jgi:hypothetical protein